MSGESLNLGENGPQQTLDEQVEKTAEKRAFYTRKFFEGSGKDLEKFATDVHAMFEEITIDPKDDKSLTMGIRKLQQLMGFPENLTKKGCDGVCANHTFTEFTKRQSGSALSALRGDIIKDQEERHASKAKAAAPEAVPMPTDDEKIESYRPGPNKGTITPKAELASRILEAYKKFPTRYFNGYGGNQENLKENFGRTKMEREALIITEDPVHPGEPIKFLGVPIRGGVNLHVLPFLAMAEKEIEDLHLAYNPKAGILGVQTRPMKIGGKPSQWESFHKYGLAIDVEPGNNDPKKTDRGNIPDEVILALARAGFASGVAATSEFSELSRDPMHFQLRFKATDPEGQALIQSSPIGRAYWKKIAPMLGAAPKLDAPPSAPRPTRKSKTETRLSATRKEEVDRRFWYENVGDPEKDPSTVKAKMITIDPITNKPVTFFNQPIIGGCLAKVYPFLKQVEKDVELEGKFKIAEQYVKQILGFNIRPTAQPGNEPPKKDAPLSKHSFGIAFDINAKDNPYGPARETLDQKKMIPAFLVGAMKKAGFSWGGDWKTPDWMHFNFDRNPAASAYLLTSDTAKRYAEALIPKSDTSSTSEVVIAPSVTPPKTETGWRTLAPKFSEKKARVSAPSQKERAPRLGYAEKIREKLKPFEDIIQRASERFHVDADLIRAVIWIESTGIANISNKEGAGGLMQLIPAIKPVDGEAVQVFRKAIKTAKGYILDERDWRGDAEKNIMAGTKLLADNLKTFSGDVILALAAYNAGPGAVKRAKGVPDKEETQKYVVSVPKTYQQLKSYTSSHGGRPDQAMV